MCQSPPAVDHSGSPTGGLRETSRSNHCVRNAGCVRRFRGDYTRALVFIAHEAADAFAHPAFRARGMDPNDCFSDAFRLSPQLARLSPADEAVEIARS